MVKNIEEGLQNIFYKRFGVAITDENREEHLFGKLRFSPYDALYLVKYIEEEFQVQIGERFFVEYQFTTFDKIKNIIVEILEDIEVA